MLKNVLVCTFHFPINEILQKRTRSRNDLIKTPCGKCLLKVTEDTIEISFLVKGDQAYRKKP